MTTRPSGPGSTHFSKSSNPTSCFEPQLQPPLGPSPNPPAPHQPLGLQTTLAEEDLTGDSPKIRDHNQTLLTTSTDTTSQTHQPPRALASDAQPPERPARNGPNFGGDSRLRGSIDQDLTPRPEPNSYPANSESQQQPQTEPFPAPAPTEQPQHSDQDPTTAPDPSTQAQAHALIYNSTHPLQTVPPNMSKVVCRVIIPTAFAGNIFGKGGSVLNEMRDTFNAKISIPNSDGPERNVYVESATAKDVASCTVALAIRIQDDMQKINRSLGKDDIELRMLLHTSQAGHVIGHKGDNITALRKETNCKIKLHSLKCPMSTDRICQLSGSVQNVTLCLDKILADLKTTPLEGNVIQYDANMFNEREDYGGFRSWIIENATGKTWRGMRTNFDDRDRNQYRPNYNDDRGRPGYNDFRNNPGYNPMNNRSNGMDNRRNGYNERANFGNGFDNRGPMGMDNRGYGGGPGGDNQYNNRGGPNGNGGGYNNGNNNNNNNNGNRGGPGVPGGLGGPNGMNNGRNDMGMGPGGPGPRGGSFDDPSEEDKVVCRLLIPTRLAGALIGKRGETVNRMRMDYNCEISIPTSTTSERTLRVMSSEHKNVVNCIKSILDEIGEDLRRSGRVMEEDQTELRLLMHTSHAGYVIGQGGKNIKTLRTDTNCRIIINTEHCPYSTDRVCQISGTAEDVMSCVDKVLIMVDETPIKGEKSRYNANFANDKVDYGGYKAGPRRSERRFGSGDGRELVDDQRMNYGNNAGNGSYNGREEDGNRGRYNNRNDRYDARNGYGNNWDSNDNNTFRSGNFNNNGRYNGNNTNNNNYNNYNGNNSGFNNGRNNNGYQPKNASGAAANGQNGNGQSGAGNASGANNNLGAVATADAGNPAGAALSASLSGGTFSGKGEYKPRSNSENKFPAQKKDAE